MADPKDPKDKKDRRQSTPVDFEKTVSDVDRKKLGQLKEDFPEGFEETVMVRLPEKDEDSFSDTTDFFGEEERTGDHVEPEPEAEQEKPKEKKPEKKKPEPSPAKVSAKAPAAKAPPPPRRPGVQDESSYTIMGQLPVMRPKISWGYLGLSLLIFFLLAEGALEVLSRGVGLRLAVIVATGAGLLLLLLMFLRRVEGRIGFLWMAVIWFGLVTYSGFYFYTSDPEALTLLKFSLSELLGWILLTVGLILTWNLWQRRRYPLPSKILAAAAFLILLLATFAALLLGTGLEGSFWGPGFLSGLPLFLKPGILALGLAFPIFFLAVLISLLLVKPSSKGSFRRFGIPLLILALLGTTLGSRLLARQGIELPLIGGWLGESFFGMTQVDPVTSAVQLKVETGKKNVGKEKEWHLEVAASRSVGKGKERESWLMVKNMEGRSLAGSMGDNLLFSRGDKPIKGGKATLQPSRMGDRKSIYALLSLASLDQPTVKIMTASALMHIARQLGSGDRLYVAGGGGMQTLTESNEAEWETLLGKALTAAPVDLAQSIPGALKKLSQDDASRQLMVVAEDRALPAAELRQGLNAQAKTNKAALNFIALGPASATPESYQAADISGLGFEMLAAAAETLGQYILQFPNLIPLPRIQLARNPAGLVDLSAGKIAFSVLASDPAAVGLIQLKVDDEKPVDLGIELNQSLDLSRFKVKPGEHRFSILINTPTGDVVSESFSGQYVTRRPLRFARPMDRDTLSGAVNVFLSPGKVQGAESGSIEVLADGVKIGGATADPYLIPLDTKSLGEGDHNLQAIQTFPDGSTETAQIQVKINQQVPQVKIVRPSIGEYLSNLAEIEAQIGGGLFEQVQKVEFLVDGEWIGESVQAPYRFLWSNNTFPAGKYFVQVRATLSSQAFSSDAVEIQLGQGEVVVQADPASGASGMLFPDNVEVLLDASASMNEPMGASFKIDLAKFALSELLQGLPQNVRLQSRVFGGESYSSQENCGDSTLLKKPASELTGVQARGTAPLAQNLKMLAQDLKKAQGSRVALLITDGWDKCGEDPLEVAATLAKQTQKIRLHIIYFADVDPATESLLKKLAELLGGQVNRVGSQDEIARAIRDSTQVSFSLYDFKNTPVLSQPLNAQPFVVRAGDYRLEIDTAPPLARDKVVIPTGSRKTFTVIPQNGNYELREE